jgi:hypothetical protein
MSEETTAALVEQMRTRYAEAARVVLHPRDDSGCGCGPPCCRTEAAALVGELLPTAQPSTSSAQPNPCTGQR